MWGPTSQLCLHDGWTGVVEYLSLSMRDCNLNITWRVRESRSRFSAISGRSIQSGCNVHSHSLSPVECDVQTVSLHDQLW